MKLWNFIKQKYIPKQPEELHKLSIEDISKINSILAASEVFQEKIKNINLEKYPEEIKSRIIRIKEDINLATTYTRILVDGEPDENK